MKIVKMTSPQFYYMANFLTIVFEENVQLIWASPFDFPLSNLAFIIWFFNFIVKTSFPIKFCLSFDFRAFLIKTFDFSVGKPNFLIKPFQPFDFVSEHLCFPKELFQFFYFLAFPTVNYVFITKYFQSFDFYLYYLLFHVNSFQLFESSGFPTKHFAPLVNFDPILVKPFQNFNFSINFPSFNMKYCYSF